MSDKSMPERMGVAETRLDLHDNQFDQHGKRIENLEEIDEQRKNAVVRAMWRVIKLLAVVTLLTFTTEKFKEKWLAIIGTWGL